MHACHLVSDWFTDIQPFRCTYFSPDVCTVTLSYSTPYQLTNASTLFFAHHCANEKSHNPPVSRRSARL